MARRKGSGRGKTTVNSRKSAAENARERLKDDTGDTTRQSRPTQQYKNLNNSNMDAAATTATTTKHYNKTTKLQNNHRRGTYRTQSGETNDNVKVQKQTAKQAKAAAQRATAVAAYAATPDSGGVSGSSNNNKSTSGAKDPLALGNDSTTTIVPVQQQSGGKAARAKEAREQKTIAKQEASGIATARGATGAASADANPRYAINSTTAITSGNNNSNNKHSDNSNSSFSKNITLSQKEVLTRKSDTPQQQPRQEVSSRDIKAVPGISANSRAAETVSNAAVAPKAALPVAEPSTWNNSRYLHKKFKRLASTTDVDSIVAYSQSVNNAGSSASSEAGSEAAQTRTTSLSSSASTSSISPPPVSTPTPIGTVTVSAAPVNASSAQNLVTTSGIQNVTAAAVLMNGHAHATPAVVLPTNDELTYTTNNQNESSKSNVIAMSLANHCDDPAQQLNAQQQCEAEQLPQTMLHILDNQQSQQSNGSNTTNTSANSGRYVCPYCNLNCTKPSVLQKHIRAHTNERPYPCDICGIAFKTNSNYYKHCRSRSHAARKRGIEVPISAEDGLFGGSDQEGDPELSNSSSDVISRTASPLEDVNSLSAQTVANASITTPSIGISPQQLQQLQQQQQKQIQLRQQQQHLNLTIQQQQSVAAQSLHHTALPSTPSPPSVSSTKSAYLQQPAQQQAKQLPLGSPAAGTLPPPSSSNANTNIGAVTPATNKHVGNAVTEHKPYKPKFHNAALYATTKEAAQAAAAAGAMPPGLLQPLPLQQQRSQGQQQPSKQQHNAPAAAQPLSMYTQPQVQAQPPTQPSPAPPSTSHPSLSPSTQVKLNNHINTHQLQLQMQQQQQYLQQQQQPLHIMPPFGTVLPLHHNMAPMSPKSAAQRPDLMNAAAVAAAANMGYMAAPRMIYPDAIDFSPEALHLMMPESRQKLQYQVQQYKWLEQELQQHLHKLNHQQHVQQQQQLQHLQTQAPPTPPAILKPTATLPMHPHHPPPPQATAASASPSQVAPLQQQPLQYLVNTAAVGQQSNTSTSVVNSGAMSGVSTSVVTTTNTSSSKNSGLLQTNIPNVTSASSAHKVADLVQEHISKLISQNEAIVENKAVLLQKKYPKGLNRSRSFNNSGNSLTATTSTSNAGGGSANLVTATSVGSESATNARLAQAIVQKQQQQQQQQLQQQLQQQQHYQQQFQQQLLAGGTHMLPPPPGQHHQQTHQQQHHQQQQQQQQQHMAQLRFEEQQQQQHQQFQQQQPQLLQPNGISKHVTASISTKAGNALASTPKQHMQAFHPQQQQHAQQPQQHAPQITYHQHASGPSALNTQKAPARPTPSPGVAQQAGVLNKDGVMSVMQQSTQANSGKNATNSIALPLNLSAKQKARQDESADKMPASSDTSTPSSTPRKRHSIENQICNTSNDGSTNSTLPPASTALSTSSASNAKQSPNVSIIKNLLLNARGLAVPTGEGEDAVYNCPLCASTFRTAEDLQLHNSTYCQGASSAPISPVSSPSYRYFRSNSISLNLPELKNSIFRSRDPLPLAKLAWYQLRTKPSSLVLSRLSASQAGSSKATTTTTTSATSTAPTSSTSSSSIASCVASPIATPPATTAAPPAALTLPDPSIVRLIDAPLPSPGPLLGKTPLVDFGNTSESRPRSEDVIITKMHEDRQFDEHTPAKRAKLVMHSSESFVLGSTTIGSSGGTLITATTSGTRLNINSISGGDMQMLTHNASSSNELSSSTIKKDERLRRFNSSGGCIIPISECSDVDKSPKMIRTPLLSGGSFQEVSPKPKDKENKNTAALSFGNSSTFTPKLGLSGLGLPTNGPQHFQFPINPITAFNPLTLPPLQSGNGGIEKVIPHVPGIPGPNSLTPQLPPPQHLQLPHQSQMLPGGRSLSPNLKKALSPLIMRSSASPKSLTTHESLKSLSPFGGVQNVPSEFDRVPPLPSMRTTRNWNQNMTTGGSGAKLTTGTNSLDVPKKPFNFTRMADNVSPRKGSNVNAPKSSPSENEVRHFNFDHLARDGGGGDSVRTTGNSAQLMPLHVDINSSVSAGAITSCSGTEPTEAEQKKTKFLRPTSLPLKPGTFTPKRHHGITPTANTLPLISPETPRPSKSCVQLYLNGHAYTYLGLKCSTKMFYCTVNCPQPSYVVGAQKLSMYSVWQVCAENNPHPLGFKPKVVMSLYDSRQKTTTSTMAGSCKMPYALVGSQQTVMTPFENNQGQWQHHQLKQISLITTTTESGAGDQLKKASASSASSGSSGSSGSGMDAGCKRDSASGQMLVGGYESHEDYTYIRGRGRGRYVCSECGIRCKKPSMLKKHIRTHTDVRPYTCKHCNFSFKTKGNLTKHMQSKTHYKKCLELGINPGPMPADGVFLEPEPEFDQQSTTSAGGRTSSIPGESDSEDYSDNESESSDTDESKSRLLEHEAARGLLSLSMTPPIGQSISPHPRSEPYPYHQGERVDLSTMSFAAQTQVAATSTTAPPTSHSTHPTNIKRVISFSSPKPPFDYQKQEQYYSNPEESKPKHSKNSGAANYESAPIDLTKPRAVTNPTPSPTVTTVTSNSNCVSNEEYNPSTVVPLSGPPVQTQAQIRDVIFGSSNESGFLKTLISVSDKVRSSTETLENYKNGDELSQAYQYHKAFQYHKIKQIQMNRSFPDMTSLNQNLATTPILTTVVGAVGAELSMAFTTTTTSNNTGIRVLEGVVNTASAANVVQTTIEAPDGDDNSAAGTKLRSASKDVTHDNVTADLQVPTMEVNVMAAPEVQVDSPLLAATTISNNTTTTTPTNAASANKQTTPGLTALPYKSSDEGEDSEYISDQEQTAVTHTSKRSRGISNSATNTNAATAEPHNAKLPAVVAQPGTTEFTGVLSTPGRTVVVGEDGLKKSGNNEIQPVYPRVRMSPDGRPVCKVCSKTFQTQGQLSLHMNIHYMERKFRCEPCGVSFRTQGHLQKHERAEAHKNKVMMTSTFGVPTTSNPRPFECTDCKIAFRIHGHLAKHLRSKTHVQKLECLQKLPFGTYAEIERAGISLTEIDTSDCENSLISLKTLAQKLIEKDPNKLGSYTTPSGMSGMGSVAVSASVIASVSNAVEATNTNTTHSAIVSQDSDSEDIFSAATMAAATAIASLDKDSAANTPRRANSTSEDEAIANGLNNNLKRRLPGNFSNGEESDNPSENCDKRARVSTQPSAATTNAVGSPASITSSNASSNN